jgi:hypothetical protein
MLLPVNVADIFILINEKSRSHYGQDKKKLFVRDAHCFAHNSETKAAIEKVNAPFCSTN